MTTFRPALTPLLLGAVLALGGCGAGDDAAVGGTFADLLPDAPGRNLVVISFDALRADALGAYGDTLGASPHIDAFAARAVVCDRAYTAAHATPSSFAAAWTGRQPFRAFRAWRLQDVPTLAGVLRAAGYRTAAFLNNRQLDPARGFDRGFDRYEVVHMPDEEAFVELPGAWLRAQEAEPFFLWIHFISPHAPYERRDLAARFYAPGYAGPFVEGTGHLGRGARVEDAADLRRIKELYTGEVFYADLLFGRLMGTLDELGLRERSVVVLTADHGDEHMDHGVVGHHQLHEEVVRIPLIVGHPDIDRPRRTDATLVNLDFLPTFAGLLGVDAPPGLDGVDVRGPHDPDRPVVFTAMTNATRFAMGLRQGDLKLIVSCRGDRTTLRLYDLAADPRELNDLSRRRPRERDGLAARLAELAGGAPCDVVREAVGAGTSDAGLSEEQVRQLRALGY